MNGRLVGIAYVVSAVFFEALGQLAFKRGADRASSDGGILAQASQWLCNRVVIAGILCFVVEAVLWTMALRLLEVSVAFPAGSLCFVFVALLARFALHEQVGFRRWIGIGLILGGVVLIGIS